LATPRAASPSVASGMQSLSSSDWACGDENVVKARKRLGDGVAGGESSRGQRWSVDETAVHRMDGGLDSSGLYADSGGEGGISMRTSSNPVNESPTPPRPAGPGGVASRNPFSSPIRGQKQSPQRKAASPTLPLKQSDREATKPKHTPLNPTTVDTDPVLPIPSSGMSRPFHTYHFS
jgi:hypothetical protein